MSHSRAKLLKDLRKDSSVKIQTLISGKEFKTVKNHNAKLLFKKLFQDWKLTKIIDNLARTGIAKRSDEPTKFLGSLTI